MPQIEKQQFKNQSGGHLGVTVITARGDDKGISVEPDGTVWLSEAEQRLTANAPRRPEDNPFIEQTLQRRSNETGELEEYTVTPLVAVSEDRFVPAEARPIPGDIPASRSAAAAQLAATAEEPTVPTVVDQGAIGREAEVTSLGEDVQPGEVPPPPARAAAAVAAADALADVPPTPADTPAPDEVDLSGLATPEPVQEPVPEAPPAPVEPTPEPPAPEPTPEPQEAPVEPQTPPEETAGQVDPAVGEETGAATPPAGPAPEGEFAASEEVGTPVPPSAPAPWSPGSQG
jgi:hypothetical protein